MSLDTPTIQEINDNLIAQISTSISQTIPLLPKSFIRVLAKSIAGVFILLYKYGGFIFLQMFVDTATANETQVNGQTVQPLLFWGRLIGVGDPTSATQAQLLIEITVENQTGTLPSNTQLINSSTGVTYITLGSIALDAPTKQITVQAISDQSGGDGSGTIGNLDAGATLSFANPLANVARDATVVSQVVTGAEAEDIEVYRQRVKDRFQKRPQGGAYADYQQWGEEVEGIVNVYPYTSSNPGQVDVYAEATIASSGNVDGIPTTAQLQAVLDSINFDNSDLATRRPANALVNAFGISRLAFDVRVLGIEVEDLASVRDSIETALTEYFLNREPYIVGLSVPPRKDRITRSAIAGAVEDIVTANNGIFASVVLSLNGTNTETYTLGVGEKAKLNSIGWV